jgi:hypothetical protein
MMPTSQKLTDVGKEIDNEMLTVLLLQGLTREHSPLRTAIENTNINLTKDYVKTELLQMDIETKAFVSNTALMHREGKTKV